MCFDSNMLTASVRICQMLIAVNIGRIAVNRTIEANAVKLQKFLHPFTSPVLWGKYGPGL